jgi:hypothetical protein
MHGGAFAGAARFFFVSCGQDESTAASDAQQGAFKDRDDDRRSRAGCYPGGQSMRPAPLLSPPHIC